MANILYPPPRPQSVGEILDSAFRIFRATLVKCLPYAIGAVIAAELANLYNLASHQVLAPLQQVRDPVWWTLYLVGILIAGAILGSAILLRQYALATGHPVSAGAELGTAARRLPGMLLLVILFVLALLVSLVPLALVAVFQGWLRLLMGLLLLLPASCVCLALSSSWPILLLTGKGALQSLIHSARLTWGSWWRLTLIYTVAVVLLVALYLVSVLIAGLTAALFAHGDILMITAVSAVLVVLLSALVTPFYYALALAVLGDLSVRREGADLAQRLATPAAS